MSQNDPNKELNLDELHQAVSQMMDQKGKPPRSVAAKVTPPSRPIAETPQQPVPKPTFTPIAAPKPVDRGMPVTVRRSPAKLTPRPRGMAMDVVQTVKPTVTPPSSQPSRTGATIQPTHTVQPEPSKPTPQPTTPKEDVSDDMLAGINMQSDFVPKPSPSNAPQPEPSFPDPLDVAGDQQTPPKSDSQDLLHDDNTMPTKNTWEMPDPLADEPAEEPTSEPEAPSIAPQPEPTGTPFVKTNVSKRPLGAYAAANPAPEPPKLAQSEELALPAPPEADELLLPEESSAFEHTPESPTEPVPAPEPKVEQPSGTLENLRQMSIPQQYKSAEKEPSHAERPVFDTKNYHTPIKPPAAAPRAASSGGSRAGMWVSIILLVILIAAGVVAYFIATGGIDVTKILGR